MLILFCLAIVIYWMFFVFLNNQDIYMLVDLYFSDPIPVTKIKNILLETCMHCILFFYIAHGYKSKLLKFCVPYVDRYFASSALILHKYRKIYLVFHLDTMTIYTTFNYTYRTHANICFNLNL